MGLDLLLHRPSKKHRQTCQRKKPTSSAVQPSGESGQSSGEQLLCTIPKFLASPVKKKFGPEVVLPTQPHPARKASYRDQAAPRSNHLDPLAWPHSPLCLTVQKISSLGLTYYFPQISSVFFSCLKKKKKDHNWISISKLID